MSRHETRVDIIGDDKFSGAMRKAELAAKGFERQLSGVGKRLRSLTGLANSMAGALGAAGVGITFRQIDKEFDLLEKSLFDMTKVTQRSAASVRAELDGLGGSFGSLSDKLTGYYEVMSAGITDSNEALTTYVAAVKMAKISNIDQATSIQAVTKMMNGYAGRIRSASEAVDLLMATERYGQTKVAELAGVVGDLAAVSEQVGASQYEMAAAMAQVTQSAGSTGQAATQVRAIMVSLLKPTERMRDLLSEMGYESGSALVREKGLADALGSIREAAEQSGEGLGFFIESSEALQGVLAISRKDFTEFETKLHGIRDGAGELDTKWQQFITSTRALKDEAFDGLRDSMAEIGEDIIPVVVQSLKDFSDWVSEHKDGIVTGFEQIGSAISVIGQVSQAVLPGFGAMFEFYDLDMQIHEFMDQGLISADEVAGSMEMLAQQVDYIKENIDELTYKKLTRELHELKKAATDLDKEFAAGGGGDRWEIIERINEVRAKIEELEGKRADIWVKVQTEQAITEFADVEDTFMRGTASLASYINKQSKDTADDIVRQQKRIAEAERKRIADSLAQYKRKRLSDRAAAEADLRDELADLNEWLELKLLSHDDYLHYVKSAYGEYYETLDGLRKEDGEKEKEVLEKKRRDHEEAMGGALDLDTGYWEQRRAELEQHLKYVAEHAEDETAVKVYAAEQWAEFERDFNEQRLDTLKGSLSAEISEWTGHYATVRGVVDEAYDDIGQGLEGIFSDSLEGKVTSFEDVIERSFGAIKSYVTKIAAEIATQQIVVPIMTRMTGSMTGGSGNMSGGIANMLAGSGSGSASGGGFLGGLGGLFSGGGSSAAGGAASSSGGAAAGGMGMLGWIGLAIMALQAVNAEYGDDFLDFMQTKKGSNEGWDWFSSWLSGDMHTDDWEPGSASASNLGVAATGMSFWQDSVGMGQHTDAYQYYKVGEDIMPGVGGWIGAGIGALFGDNRDQNDLDLMLGGGNKQYYQGLYSGELGRGNSATGAGMFHALTEGFGDDFSELESGKNIEKYFSEYLNRKFSTLSDRWGFAMEEVFSSENLRKVSEQQSGDADAGAYMIQLDDIQTTLADYGFSGLIERVDEAVIDTYGEILMSEIAKTDRFADMADRLGLSSDEVQKFKDGLATPGEIAEVLGRIEAIEAMYTQIRAEMFPGLNADALGNLLGAGIQDAVSRIEQGENVDFGMIGQAVNDAMIESMENSIINVGLSRLEQQMQGQLVDPFLDQLIDGFMTGGFNAESMQDAFNQIQSFDISDAAAGITEVMTALKTGQVVDFEEFERKYGESFKDVWDGAMEPVNESADPLENAAEHIESAAQHLEGAALEWAGGAVSDLQHPGVAGFSSGLWRVHDQEMLALIHQDEMVIPAHIAPEIREYLKARGLSFAGGYFGSGAGPLSTSPTYVSPFGQGDDGNLYDFWKGKKEELKKTFLEIQAEIDDMWATWKISNMTGIEAIEAQMEYDLNQMLSRFSGMGATEDQLDSIRDLFDEKLAKALEDFTKKVRETTASIQAQVYGGWATMGSKDQKSVVTDYLSGYIGFNALQGEGYETYKGYPSYDFASYSGEGQAQAVDFAQQQESQLTGMKEKLAEGLITEEAFKYWTQFQAMQREAFLEDLAFQEKVKSAEVDIQGLRLTGQGQEADYTQFTLDQEAAAREAQKTLSEDDYATFLANQALAEEQFVAKQQESNRRRESDLNRRLGIAEGVSSRELDLAEFEEKQSREFFDAKEQGYTLDQLLTLEAVQLAEARRFELEQERELNQSLQDLEVEYLALSGATKRQAEAMDGAYERNRQLEDAVLSGADAQEIAWIKQINAAEAATEVAAMADEVAAEWLDLTERGLSLEGQDELADALGLINKQEKELAQARASGASEAYLKRLEEIQEMERAEWVNSRMAELAKENQDNAQELLDTFQGLADGLRDTIRSLQLGDLSTWSPEEKLAQLESEWIAAKDAVEEAKESGDQETVAEAMAGLSGIGREYVESARGYYASSTDYGDTFDDVIGTLGDSAEYADDVVDVQQATIDALQQEIDLLTGIKEEIVDPEDFEAHMTWAQEKRQEMVDWAETEVTAIYGVTNAINQQTIDFLAGLQAIADGEGYTAPSGDGGDAATGNVSDGGMDASGLPTSPDGLSIGDRWVDTDGTIYEVRSSITGPYSVPIGTASTGGAGSMGSTDAGDGNVSGGTGNTGSTGVTNGPEAADQYEIGETWTDSSGNIWKKTEEHGGYGVELVSSAPSSAPEGDVPLDPWGDPIIYDRKGRRGERGAADWTLRELYNAAPGTSGFAEDEAARREAYGEPMRREYEEMGYGSGRGAERLEHLFGSTGNRRAQGEETEFDVLLGIREHLGESKEVAEQYIKDFEAFTDLLSVVSTEVRDVLERDFSAFRSDLSSIRNDSTAVRFATEDTAALSRSIQSLTSDLYFEQRRTNSILSDMAGYAGGGEHSGGWRVVGEQGPELEYTGPSKIYNAADTKQMLAAAPDVVKAVNVLGAKLDAVLQALGKGTEVQTAAAETLRQDFRKFTREIRISANERAAREARR